MHAEKFYSKTQQINRIMQSTYFKSSFHFVTTKSVFLVMASRKCKWIFDIYDCKIVNIWVPAAVHTYICTFLTIPYLSLNSSSAPTLFL